MIESDGFGAALPAPDRTLLQQLLGGEEGSGDVFPLSFPQERLWFLDQLEPGSPLYNIPTALHVRGRLRPALLREVLRHLVSRHESLRTVFPAVDGRPVQLVLASRPIALPICRLGGLRAPLREAMRLVGEQARQPFDLRRGPLLRAALLELGPDEWLLCLTLHHIVSDGWSNAVLMREMTALYAAGETGQAPALPELPIQYADFAVWQRQQDWQELAGQLAYWRRRLAGVTALALPADRPRQAVSGPLAPRGRRGAQLAVGFPPAIAAGLAALARDRRVTLFTVLLAVLDVLLHRTSGQTDLAVGTLVANRGRGELEGLVGCFADALVLRADLGGDPSCNELLDRLGPQLLDAWANGDLPFARLVEELQPERSLGQTPFFQVMLLQQDAPEAAPALGGAALDLLPVDNGTAKLDLLLSLTHRGAEIAGTLEYDAGLFDAATVERLVRHLGNLGAAAVRDPDCRISELPMMTMAEESAVLMQSRGERQEWGARCVHQLFEEHAARSPRAPALICEDQLLTYGELDARTNQLARRLRSLGVGPEVRAAICLERSPELLVAILAVLKAGGAYVPLDVRSPRRRLSALLADAGARVLISTSTLAAGWPRLAARPVLLDVEREALAGQSAAALDAVAAPGNLAYVIYTSGSTGRPKGVALEHRQLHHYLAALLRRLDLPTGSSFATVSTIAADLGNTCVFGAVASGGCLHLVAEERIADAAAMAELGARQPVDVLKIVPSHLAALLTAERPERLLPRRLLILGGEAASWALVEKVRALAPGCAVLNHYGPTETAVGVATCRLDAGTAGAGTAPPIGRPLDRTALYLLDRALRPVPGGVPAALFVAGPGLARGYLGRPALTAERFVPDPFGGEPGGRLYATGDLARYRSDGNLEFLGRADGQVKIRGFRIELGEIEAVLATHPQVWRASVGTASGPQGTYLIAWFAASPEAAAAPAPDELRAFLAERLPSAMVPHAFVRLAAMPLTANGKVDRRALALLPGATAAPLPAAGAAVAGGAPASPVEELLCAIWAELLGAAPRSLDDSFFDLGGHSLLATQLASRIRQVFQLELPLRQVFETPTIAGLTRWLDTAGRRTSLPPLEPAPRLGPLPLAPAQERLWFLHQIDPHSPAYNLSYFARLGGPLRVPALQAALRMTVDRHEVLRTAFIAENGRPAQHIQRRVSLRLPILDLGRLPGPGREAEVRRLAAGEARQPFDLGRAPLLRSTLLRLGEGEHVLLLTLHHLVSDAWSRQILGREIAAGYGAAAAGQACQLAAPAVQYADFAVWQGRWLQGETLAEQIGYWRRRLAGCEPLDLPADRRRPPVRSQRGAAIPFHVPPPLVADLLATASGQGATLFMALLAVFQALLLRYTGKTDVCVGAPISGRDATATEGLIGVFVNTLVLRGDLAGDPSGAALLRRTREVVLEDYAHRHLAFQRLVEELQPERDLSRTPLFQVMLMLHNVPAGGLELPGLAVAPLEVDNRTAKLDLTLALQPAAEGLAGSLEYSTDLFRGATIERLGRHLGNLLAALAADPGRPLSQLDMLSGAERQQLLRDWNDTEVEPAPGDGCIHQLFARQASATPRAIALRCGDAALTYAELERRVSRLAQHLRGLGVGPESRLGIQLERSPAMVVALLAVLEAGGAYVPLDPSYPAERLALMLADSAAAAVVVGQRRSGPPPALPAVVLDEAEGLRAGERADAPLPAAPGEAAAASGHPDQLAYVIYTSGSTGRPKGVMVTHRNVVNFFAGMDRRLGASPPGVWLAVTSISFDISVLEILWTLTRGFEVVVQEQPPRLAAAAGETPALPAAELAPAERTPGPLPAVRQAARPLEFSLFYFASEEQAEPTREAGNGYRLLLEGARFADRHGFAAVWTPERHFHAFGGLFPNPSVVGAALAVLTERVQIRAGSVVLPLHQPLRVAEEWAVVDRLSGGRVGISFASGWHADDFVLAPESYRQRKEIMTRGIDTVRRLWRGEPIALPGGAGRPVEVRIHPRPVQAELPVWMTAAGNPDTFRLAGEMGAGLLTHLLGQEIAELAEKIAVYREAFGRSGAAGRGRVTLMLHTFVGHDLEEVREKVRQPFCGYLKSSLALWRGLARGLGHDLEKEVLTPAEEDALLSRAFDRYFETCGLLGTPASVQRQLDRLRAADVDEVGCLIDFGVDVDSVLASLEVLRGVVERHRSASAGTVREDETSIAARIRRHRVTHLQCTPSMARMLTLDPDTLDALGGLRALLVGGEALGAPLAEQLCGVVHGEVYNMYGPTETTVWSAAHLLGGREDGVAIGRPIANTAIHLLDADLGPVPAGVPGALHIGGAGVARGYQGRPDLTAERFIPDPFGPAGGRLYATGDRARYRTDGAIEFLGRTDHQVKIRGYRIETGEVAAALRRHPLVAEAVVTAREDRADDRRLVAYVVPAGNALRPALPAAEIERLFAGRRRYRLPNGMEVAVLSEFQASLAFHEIFQARTYLRHGIALHDGDCVLDVGANVGFFSLFASRERRGVTIHAFEPIPPSRDTLRANVALYGLPVQVHDFGLSARPEEDVEFVFYPEMSGLSGRYSEAARDMRATREIMLGGLRDAAGETVRSSLDGRDLDELLAAQFASERHRCRLRTLSQVVREQGIERIDLLKIDVERAEVDVLLGIEEEHWPLVRQVVMEVDGRDNLGRVTAILESHGLAVVHDTAFYRAQDEDGPEVFVGHLYASRDGLAPREAGPPAAADAPAALSTSALRDFLAASLPDYMVPAAVVVLDHLPLTPNGKVDRRALPAPESSRPRLAAVYEAPVSEPQQAIAAVWRQVLQVEQVGLQDNFFELGGSSLTLVEVRARLREDLGYELSLVDMFRAPTVAALARLVGGRAPAAVDAGAGGPAAPAFGEARERARRRRRTLRVQPAVRATEEAS
jgi:natural product biosynthesis luciferase-like monooxygenase protein/amino acid adenylation domain-containing protein/FkbM family methyltransferase